MSNKLEISLDLARRLLPCLKGSLQACENNKLGHSAAIEDCDREIVELKTSIAELEARLADAEKPPIVDGITRKRQLKGHAGDAIFNLLTPQPKGLSISEIQSRTGFNRSVIYKTLHREADRFDSDRKGKLWRVKLNEI
jgi:hypothetical protein